jgi:hypothetical protein
MAWFGTGCFFSAGARDFGRVMGLWVNAAYKHAAAVFQLCDKDLLPGA